MAVALLRLLPRVIPYLSNILRAQSFFKSVNSVRKIESAILKYEDIKDLVNRDKNIKEYINNQLFNLQLKSNHFIFFNEEDLINYVKSKDSEAKILKIVETKEIDLYIVEARLYSNKWSGMLNLVSFALLFNALNLFETSVLARIVYTEQQLQNKLNKLKDNINNKIDELNSKITYYKNLDIHNTYCMRCSCCCGCSCDMGSCSCCCSCECTLVHYTQAWEDLRNYVLNNFKTYVDNEIKSYSEFLNDIMIKNSTDSLKAQFLTFFTTLMNFMFLQIKEKYLFAVIKEKEILKELKKEKKKNKVCRLIYKFLCNLKGSKIEYNKFITKLQKYLYYKLKREYTRKQLITLYNTVKKRYNMKIIKIKKDKKVYLVIA